MSKPKNDKAANSKLDKDISKLKAALNSKPSKDGKSKGSTSKGSGKGEKTIPTGSRKYGNDVKWWNGYKEISDQAAKIAFNNKAGEEEIISTNSDVVVPGCVSIRYMPTMGKAKKWSDAVNVQMKALWLDLHRKYRGVGGYESADLGMALFSIADFFAQIAEAERMYGTMVKFDSLNVNTPYTVLMAEGAPVSFTGRELANFRADLNLIIAAAKTLNIPKGIPLFEAMIERCSGVYKDADSAKSTFCVFTTPMYVKFMPQLVTTGSALKYVWKQYTNYSGNLGNYDYEPLNDIITRLNDQLQALLLDSDVQRMCSDFIAAYGLNEVRTLDYVLENLAIDYIKDDGIALQIHNARFLGADMIDFYPAPQHVPMSVMPYLDSGSPATFYIYQVDNVIYCDFALHDGGAQYQYIVNNGENIIATDKANILWEAPVHGALLDTWTGQPSVDDVIEMTRLTYASTFTGVTNASLSSGSGMTVDNYFGVFVPLNFSFFTNPTTNTQNDSNYHFRNVGSLVFNFSNDSGFITSTRQFLTTATNDLRYDWFPILYIADKAVTPYTTNWKPSVNNFLIGGVRVRAIGDIVNIKNVDFDTLRRLHDACSMGAWKVQLDTLTVKE